MLRVRRTNLYRADRFYCPCAQILLFRVYLFNSLILFLSPIGRNATQCFFAKYGRHTVVFKHIINTGISIKKTPNTHAADATLMRFLEFKSAYIGGYVGLQQLRQSTFYKKIYDFRKTFGERAARNNI